MKIWKALTSKTSLIVLLLVSNILWGTYYFKDRQSYKTQMEMLDGAYKHILEDKSLQINLGKQFIDSLVQIPKASSDENMEKVYTIYKNRYNIITLTDSSKQEFLISTFREIPKTSPN